MTRNVYLLLLSCLLLFSADGFGQGKSKNKGNNGNGPKEEKSVFPPYGNTGIGIRYPTEKLEVIGNAKISQTVMANELNVIGIQATSLTIAEDATIGSNLLVEGSIGIGVAVPTEKLDIAGNLRVSSTVFSDQLNTTTLNAATGTLSGRLSVGENMLISGLTGMGVDDPVERLEVAGNIKSTQNIITIGLQAKTGTLSGRLSVGENVLISGLTGMGVSEPSERLDVAGNIKVSQSLLANSFQVENGKITSDLTVDKNTIIKGNMGVGVDLPTERLEVSGNIKASENIIGVGLQAEEGTLSKGLTIGENLSVSGNIGIRVANASEALEVAGNVKVTGSVSSNTVNTQVVDTEDANIKGDLTVLGNINAGEIKATILEVDEIRTSNQEFEQLTVSRIGVNTVQGVPAGYMMAVNGRLLATQVEVFAPQDWPDYVFEDNYQLRPLAEVAYFINKHGHLPNMPSADDMQQGGYSVSQMDANLLEKIEELTLYMIELKQENEALKLQLEGLKK